MSARAHLWTASVLLACGVLLRAFPFVWWPATHFDSDQAIVGLMAKHISEGQAWPLFYYGQHYMLGVEAYLAAPIMWALGPTVPALKAPLVLVNIAAVVLLLRLAVRDARLHPWAAFIAALPLALPSAVVAARTTEANGGNVEPWLYVLILWLLRARPFAFGTFLGFGMLHREFTAYGAAALLLMDLLALPVGGEWRRRGGERLRHWGLAGVAWVATRAVANILQPFANGLGPGTRGDDPLLAGAVVDTLGGRLCLAPETWSARATQLFGDHLPRLVGGTGAALRDYGVLSGVFSGQSGLGPWVAAITTAGLVAGAWYWWVRYRSPAPETVPHLGGYLLLVGLISTAVYGFATCSNIRVETLRYNLLGVFIPVGALIMGLQAWRHPAARAGFGAAVALWCLVNTLDIAALTEEYRTRPPLDQRQALADALVARGVASAYAQARTAYHVTFLASERVRVAAVDFSRVRAYDVEAALAGAPTIAELPCAGGEPLPGGQFLCPSAAAPANGR